MQKGKFIVIDGSDGSGKKTQTDLLLKYLKSQKIRMAYYDFPQYDKTFFGKMVGKYLNGEYGDVSEVDPYLGSLLYAGDRWQASEKIKKDLAAGKVVVTNRYTQSNMGFQTAKINDEKEKKKFLNWLENLEYKVYNIPKVDKVIYLYVPFKTAQELVGRKSARNYTKLTHDIHERDTAFMQKVEKQYLWLAKNYQEWETINCIEAVKLLTPKEIAKKVIEVVEKTIR